MPDGTEMARIRECCRDLFESTWGQLVAIQAERVVRHILDRRGKDVTLSARANPIVTLLRSCQLLSDTLQRCVDNELRNACPMARETAAAAFSVSAFPQRVNAGVATQASERVPVFLDKKEEIRSIAVGSATGSASTDSLLGLVSDRFSELSPAISYEQKLTFMCDLAGIDREIDWTSIHDSDSHASRLIGAALLLCSLDRQRVSAMVGKYWLGSGGSSQAAIVDQFRKVFFSPPSTFSPDDAFRSGGSPQWSQLYAQIKINTYGLDDHHIETFVRFEKRARGYMERIPGVDRLEASDAVHDLWSKSHELVTSGFPYYRFQAKFSTWWEACFKNERIRRRCEVPLDEAVSSGDVDIHNSIMQHHRFVCDDVPSIDSLRINREIFRLVRGSFTAKQRKGWTDDQIVAANENLRNALSVVWENWMLSCGDSDQPPLKYESLAEQLQMDANSLATYCRRVRIRMWACTLARVMGLPNREIMSEKVPRCFRREGANPTQIAAEPAAMRVAMISRLAGTEETMLWAYFLFMLRNPHIIPQRKDPWKPERIVTEIWWWLRDCDSPGDEVFRGNRSGGPIDKAVAKAMKNSEVVSFVESLKSLEDASGSASPQRSRALEHVEALVNEMLQPDGAGLVSPDFFKDLKRGVDSHVCSVPASDGDGACCKKERDIWVLPVWYLAVLEQESRDSIVERLKADAHDREIVDLIISLIEDQRRATRGPSTTRRTL